MPIFQRCPMCRGEGFTDVTIGAISAEADLCGVCDGEGKIAVPLDEWMREMTASSSFQPPQKD